MSPSAATTSVNIPLFVGTGTTDRDTLNAFLRARHRGFTPVKSATIRGVAVSGVSVSHHGFAEGLSGVIRSWAAKPTLTNYASTEADLGTLRWDRLRRLLTFESSTFIVQTNTIFTTHFPLVTEDVMDRIRTLPVRCNFTAAFVTNITTGSVQSPFTNVIANSTDPLLAPSDFVRRKAVDIFTAAAEETFEDGMGSNFSQDLATFLKAHGKAALAAVQDLILSPETNVEVAVEAARLLGAVDDPTSRSQRRAFLEKLLDSPSVRIRHAAASGLAALDDLGSLAALAGAIKREGNLRLRQYLKLVVDQLERMK